MMAHGEENTTFAPNGTTPAPHHHSDEALLQRDGIALLCIIVTLLVVIVVLIGCLCRRRRRQALGEEGPLLQSRSNQPSSSRVKDSAATGFGSPVVVDVDANEQAVLQSDAREALALLHTFCEPPTSGLVSLPLLLRHGRFSEEHRLPKHSGFTCTLAFEPSTPRGVPRLYVTLLPAAPPPSLVDLWSKMCNRSCPVVLGSGNAAFKDGLDCVWLGKFFKYERVAGQNIVFTSSRATPLSAVNAAAFSHTVIRDMFRDIAHSIHVLRVHGWRYEMADAQQLLKVVGLTNDQQRPALQFMFPSLLVPVEPNHNIAYDMYLLATVLCQWLPLDSTLLQPAASIRERAWLSFTGDASQPREGLFMDWNLSKSSSTLAYVQLMLRGIADEATKKEQYSVFLWARAYARFLVTANFDSPKDGDSTTTTTFVPSWLAPSRTGVGGFESSHTAVLEAGLCWLYSLAFSAGMLRGTADVTSWTNAVRLEADIRQQLQCFRSSQANAVSATNNQRLMLPTGELNLELVLQAAGSREHMVSPLSQLLSAININGNSEYNAPTQFTKISKWTIDRVESAVAQLKFGDMIAIATGVSKDGHKLGHLVSFVETVHLHELEGTHGFEQRVFVVFDSANTGSMVVLRGVVKSQVSAFLWKGLLEAEAPLRQRYSSLLEDQANLNHLVGYTEKDLKFPIDVYRLSSRDGPRAAAPTRSEGGGSVVSVDTYSPDQ